MEEGMGTTTINDYLAYVPVRDVRHSFSSSSTRTTKPKNPRDLVEVKIVVWEKFAESVQRERKRALAQQSDMKLMPLWEKSDEVSFIQNEVGVDHMLSSRLFKPLKRLLRKVGVTGDFIQRPAGIILDPDWSWNSKIMNDSTSTNAQDKTRSVDKILIEVKKSWAFDAPDDLVKILNSELSSPSSQDNQNSIAQEAAWAVSQLYGYLSINRLQYGVLCTFDKYFFMRRLENQNAEDCSKLEITHAIRWNQTREDSSFTLMEAWLTIIMGAESSYIITSPFSSPAGNKSKPRKPLELVHDFKLGNFFFGSRLSRSQFGVVVYGGLRGKEVPESVLKIIDTSKSLDNEEKARLEVSAYRALEKLQNEIVPEVIGFFMIHDWVMILVLCNCGKNIKFEQFMEHYVQIRSMVEQIHREGVAHGDITLQNIVIDDTTGKLTIIDFSKAHLRSLCSVEEFETHCKEDLDAMEDLHGLWNTPNCEFCGSWKTYDCFGCKEINEECRMKNLRRQ